MKFRSFVLFRVGLNNVDMKNTVLQRIIDFSESVFLSKKKFAEAIGMEQTTVNNQLIGKRGLSIDLVLSVLDTFKDVSAEWLLRGEGEMKKQSSEIVSEDNIKIDINMDSKDVVIKALTEKIQRLESENAELRRKYEPSEERPSA